METLRFVIVDDLASYRSILRDIIESKSNWELVGEGTTGLEATQLVAQYHPDVVLLDINMPVMNGIEATRRIKKGAWQTCVLVFSGYNDEEFRRASLLVGADAYLPKEDVEVESLSRIIKQYFGETEEPRAENRVPLGKEQRTTEQRTQATESSNRET